MPVSLERFVDDQGKKTITDAQHPKGGQSDGNENDESLERREHVPIVTEEKQRWVETDEKSQEIWTFKNVIFHVFGSIVQVYWAKGLSQNN